jgi:hypothetical protein
VEAWQQNRELLYALLSHARRLELAQGLDVLWDTLAECQSLADAGEEGVAFEILCDNLYEHDVRVTAGFLREVRALGERYGIEPTRYGFLEKLLT